MRKIEEKMLAAVESGKDWRQGNTKVIQGGMVSCVLLYDNIIATFHRVFGRVDIIPVRDVFRRYPTRTTASRLRALGVDASIRGGVAYIDGEPA